MAKAIKETLSFLALVTLASAATTIILLYGG